MSNDFQDFMIQEARLDILQELQKQPDGRLVENLLEKSLEICGHRNRSRDWLRTQMRKLEELGAVKLWDFNEKLTAEILRAGVEHIEHRSTLEGVAVPERRA